MVRTRTGQKLYIQPPIPTKKVSPYSTGHRKSTLSTSDKRTFYRDQDTSPQHKTATIIGKKTTTTTKSPVIAPTEATEAKEPPARAQPSMCGQF